jgi:branched-chain amino acid transport system ATP-binding protein
MKGIMLKIEDLNAFYGNIRALCNININVERGKIVSIIGANGAGKSTLLKTISGLIHKRTGKILFKEKDIINFSADRIVGLGISQVPEGRQLFAHLKVLDNIRLGAYSYYNRRNLPAIREKIQNIYKMFPLLEKRSDQVAGTLSGGEQQMLAIARALMARPELILLDEPSMGIAPLVVREIFRVIEELNKSGTTVLIVEQNARAALKISDYSYVLEGGKVALEGFPNELLGNSKIKEVYLGG